MIKHNSMLKPIGEDSPRYHFKIRGSPGFYDELNNNSHIRNQEIIKKEFMHDQRNRVAQNNKTAAAINLKHQQTAQKVATENETARYLKLLHSI